ncbi:HAD family hydrolase [Arcobacter sp. FWKO B]|uniref:HAD family hydrolase n=1 Tax=Arcobacter sp. FWKO B TaxID=2593672 RepID=UPI0018A48A68|nr:HAD family hydrolase [Arcobacter sp. FWKO B]QOG12313.1 HAD family hydrolase [Arcobacter sp. FWKO B]
MKRIILFDLDGTVIDSTDAIVETFFYVFEKKQLDLGVNDENIKKLIGYPLDIMFEDLGVDKRFVNEFVDEYKLRYRDISKAQTTLLKNAKESLEVASKFARLGVVTTKTGMYSKPLLEHLGIDFYFECLIGREHVQNPKPHPEPIYKAIEQMNVNIKENDIYMIGDTKLDLIASKNAGINGVGVLSGYGTKEELQEHSEWIYNDVLDAVRFIQSKYI